MERRRWMLLALTALAAQAHAQRVYKCHDGHQVIYQSVPCAKEHDTGVSRPVVRDPQLTSADHQRVAEERSRTRDWIRQNAGYGAPPVQGTVIDAARDPEACEQARVRKEMAELFDSRDAAQSAASQIERACAKR